VRLDVWLHERGLAETREKAQALVLAGRVRVAGEARQKPGAAVPEGAHVEVLPGPAHVGRGALKLEARWPRSAWTLRVPSPWTSARPRAASRRSCSLAARGASMRWTWGAASSTSGCAGTLASW